MKQLFKSVNTRAISYMGCRYCDGASSHFPYGPEESCHCTSCGAEWEPILIHDEVEVEAPAQCYDCGVDLPLSIAHHDYCESCNKEYLANR